MYLTRVQQLQIVQAALNLEQDQGDNHFAQALVLRRARRRRRRFWVRTWLLRRPEYGQYENLMKELEMEDTSGFKNFLRMEPAMFYELLQRLSLRISKKDTWFRKAHEPGLRLAITLRYLASGDNYHSLMYGFRVAHNTISLTVREVCEAIIEEYGEEVLSCPTTPEAWKEVAAQFGSRWNFFHALGALDGKHVAIRCPKRGGSLYYNYKGFHSIILLALCDADYKFLWVDAGTNGSVSDAQLFNDCELRETIEDGSIGFPAADRLPQDDQDMPYFIIGDNAFPLRTWLMKPFARRNLDDEERIFNYRVSRARRIVENSFGILANRFQVLLTTMRQEPETVATIVLACCCLHNLMRLRYPSLQNAVLDQEDANHNVIPGAWRQNANMHDMENVCQGNRTTRSAKSQRLYLKHYYNSPVGAVPWQRNMI